MNKALLHERIRSKLTERYNEAVKAAQQAYETATHEENVAENKYDTLGLEASYLAEGQSRRVAQADEDQHSFALFSVKEYTEEDPINYGALVSLMDSEEHVRWVFLSPCAGGLRVYFDQHEVMLVTAEAPLGKILVGAYVGDEIAFNAKHYSIESVF